MPLAGLYLQGCENLTGDGFGHLRGLPLATLDLCHCSALTDAGMQGLQGLPLTVLGLCESAQLTDAALGYLAGMPLDLLLLRDCPLISDDGLEALRGLPKLSSVTIEGLPEVTDAGILRLLGKGLPFGGLSVSKCSGLSTEFLNWLSSLEAFMLGESCLSQHRP